MNRELPASVKTIRDHYDKLNVTEPSGIHYTANALIQDTQELATMWRSIENHSQSTDSNLWVWSFLEAAQRARVIPPFAELPRAEQLSLARDIEFTANSLAQKIEDAGLIENLVYNDGKIFNGFFIYEDFSEKNREIINQTERKRLPTSTLVREVGARAKQQIEDEEIKGNKRANFKARRFARKLAERNSRPYIYNQPLNAVVATATNTLFGTKYSASDIHNLCKPRS